MRLIYFLFFFILLSLITRNVSAQQFPQSRNNSNMNVGHFYGKVLDAKTNKPVEAATVQLTGGMFDTSTKKLKPAILKTVLTENNGDFSLDNLKVFGNFTLKISAVGYKPYTQQVTFGLKFQNNANANQQDRLQQMMNMVDKDLGNIKLEQD